MVCYHPLKGFILGKNEKTKNDILKVVSYDVNYLWRRLGEETLHKSKEPVLSNGQVIVYSNFKEIPCGKCVGCRLEYSRQWANRILLESKYHTDNYFITLTYNDEHLPTRLYDNKITGEINAISHPLVKEDVTKFIKRLRRKLDYYGYDSHFKYYLCGEYGDKSARPHYHICLMGCRLDDLTFYKSSELGFNYYNSKFLDSCWTDSTYSHKEFNDETNQFVGQKGYIVVAPLTWESAAYTARYVMKKRNGKEKDFYENNGIISEFTQMSKGIAKDYYKDNRDAIYEYDEIIVSTANGAKKFKPSRFFDTLYRIDNETDFERIKANRERFAKNRRDLELAHTSLDYKDYLKVKEDKKTNATKQLIRYLND